MRIRYGKDILIRNKLNEKYSLLTTDYITDNLLLFPKSFDVDFFTYLFSSNNKLKDYDDYINRYCKDILKYPLFKNIFKTLLDNNFNKEIALNEIKKEFFISFNNELYLNKYIKLRLWIYNKIISNIKEVTKDNIIEPGYLDFTNINGGVVYHTLHELKYFNDFLNNKYQILYNLSLHFDCVLLGHGENTVTYHHDDNLIRYNGLKYRYHKLCERMYPERFEVKDELDKVGKLLNKSSRWTIQPIKIDNIVTDDINILIDKVINKGYKNILILSCNPGHNKLNIKNEKVSITMARNNLLMNTKIEG